MQGTAASPARANNCPFDRTDAWTVVGKQDFAIQIESQQNGARFWVIPEQRRSAVVANNVRGALEAIDRDEELIKMTLAAMMVPK